ncbi:hypothetical protein [Ideonella sp. YS5]|uniref:hypothetical protein n=1 Tax=Ideonella sp. YS5 TaxID=3453714 RepID=UPI003EECFF46
MKAMTLTVRSEVLRQAARVLESRGKRPTQALFCWQSGYGERRFLATFAWPGVVEVFDHNTGELAASSLPGQPFQLNTHRFTAA